MDNKLRSEIVCMSGIWMPCEYETRGHGVVIKCLGDVDRDCISMDRKARPLAEAVSTFFAAISEARKIIVLVSREGVDVDAWPFRQVLKADLVAELNHSHECVPA